MKTELREIARELDVAYERKREMKRGRGEGKAGGKTSEPIDR